MIIDIDLKLTNYWLNQVQIIKITKHLIEQYKFNKKVQPLVGFFWCKYWVIN